LGFDSAADESGGEELCSFAPPELSPAAPSVDFILSSLAASDSGGAELCSLAPVDLSEPAESSAARDGLALKIIATARASSVRVIWAFLILWVGKVRQA
jgi:hypothetical protein